MSLFIQRKASLAPLVGGSDLSFRMLARKYGAEVTYTPMCIADYYLNRHTKRYKHYIFEFDPTDRPLFLQLAGNTAEPIIVMANDPELVQHVDAVDLNCGCPQGFAMEKGYGSGLLSNTKFGPDYVVDLCAAIVKGIQLPLTVKIRLYKDTEETIKFVKRLADVGVQAVTIHGRFWWQKGEKRGVADWDAIRTIRSSVPIPIVANGDIRSYDELQDALQAESVDGVMVGYGALRDPTLFQKEKVPIEQVVRDYLSIAQKHENKLIDVQRHLYWLLKHCLEEEEKPRLFSCSTMADVCCVLSSLKAVSMDLEWSVLCTGQDRISPYDPNLKRTKGRKRKKPSLRHCTK